MKRAQLSDDRGKKYLELEKILENSTYEFTKVLPVKFWAPESIGNRPNSYGMLATIMFVLILWSNEASSAGPNHVLRL